MAAGCVALLKQDNPAYTTQEIREAITHGTWTRVPSHSPSVNSTIYPRLDCLAAVEWQGMTGQTLNYLLKNYQIKLYHLGFV